MRQAVGCTSLFALYPQVALVVFGWLLFFAVFGAIDDGVSKNASLDLLASYLPLHMVVSARPTNDLRPDVAV
jgi:hypothetical protein